MTHGRPISHPPWGSGSGAPPVVLWIGRGRVPTGLLPASLLKPEARIAPLRLPDLTPGRLASLAPRAVLSTLAWPGGDVLEAGMALAELRFAGPYRALAPPLPDSAMIEREVRLHCPGLDFAVIEIGG